MDPIAEEYIKSYKRLEQLIKARYPVPRGKSPVRWLKNNVRYFERYGNELDYCADVRNLLQHGEEFQHGKEYEDYGLNDRYLVVPSHPMMATLRRVINEIERIKFAYELGVGTGEMTTASIDSKVLPVMRKMAENSYSYVPIVIADVVKGVFSESTLLDQLLAEEIVGFSEDSEFSEIRGLLPVEAHRSETFEFAGMNETATDIADRFSRALQHQERLGAVFVTNDGTSKGKLRRMITAWDMADYF